MGQKNIYFMITPSAYIVRSEQFDFGAAGEQFVECGWLRRSSDSSNAQKVTSLPLGVDILNLVQAFVLDSV